MDKCFHIPKLTFVIFRFCRKHNILYIRDIMRLAVNRQISYLNILFCVVVVVHYSQWLHQSFTSCRLWYIKSRMIRSIKEAVKINGTILILLLPLQSPITGRRNHDENRYWLICAGTWIYSVLLWIPPVSLHIYPEIKATEVKS